MNVSIMGTQTLLEQPVSGDDDDATLASVTSKESTESHESDPPGVEPIGAVVDGANSDDSTNLKDSEHDSDEDVKDGEAKTAANIAAALANSSKGSASISLVHLYDKVASKLLPTKLSSFVPSVSIFRSRPMTADRLKKAQMDHLCILHYLYAYRRIETKELATYLNDSKIRKAEATKSIATVFKLATLTQVAFQAWVGLFFDLGWSARREVLQIFLDEIAESKTYWSVQEQRSELGGAIFDPIFVKAKNAHYAELKQALEDKVKTMRANNVKRNKSEDEELEAEQEELKAMKKDLQEEVKQLRAKKRGLKTIQAELERKRLRAEDAKASRVTMEMQAQQELDDVIIEEQTNKKKRRLV